MPRRRYFTLTKEFLFYSKSEQVSILATFIQPFMWFLKGLQASWYHSINRSKAWEKEKGTQTYNLNIYESSLQNTFEVINKRAAQIKVKKPSKKSVSCKSVVSAYNSVLDCSMTVYIPTKPLLHSISYITFTIEHHIWYIHSKIVSKNKLFISHNIQKW